jgi:hypothetical protein
MTANDVLVLVILVVELGVVLFMRELPDWMMRSRWTYRRMSRRHIALTLTSILIVALLHDFG